MNNEKKDTDKLKATKEAVEYYREDVNANTFGMVIFLIGLPIAGVVLMAIYPDIWWFAALIAGGVTLLLLVLYLLSNNIAKKRLKKMEEELLEMETKLAEDKENNEQYEKQAYQEQCDKYMEKEEKDTDKLKTTKEAVCYEKEIAKGRLIAAPFYMLLFVLLLVVGVMSLFSLYDVKSVVTGIGAIVFGVYGLISVSGTIKKQVLILKDFDKESEKKTNRKETK